MTVFNDFKQFTLDIYMLYYQEDEVTDELITFHEAVNQMQLQEEELIDTHHQLIEVV